MKYTMSTRHASLPMLGLALLTTFNCAQATESVFHNDMDSDGRSDLIWQNASTGAIVYWSGASPSSARKVLVTLGYNVANFDPRRMRVLFAYSDDFSIPSRNALYVRDASSGAEFSLFELLENDGSYAAFNSGVGTPDWLAVGAGDFDGNGSADVFYRNLFDGRNLTLRDASAGDDWPSIHSSATVTNLAWTVAGIGDFDGDGRSDVLWRNGSSGRNAIWRSGNAATSLGIATVANLDWKIAAVGDFNGNGRSDILWRNSRTGANVIWKSGSSLMPQAVTSVTNLAWKVVATGDFNGDGKWDLVWRNSATGANRIWNSANAATGVTLPAVNLGWSVLM